MNPLWLPAGSIRSILALALLGVTCYLFVAGQSVPPALLVLDGAVFSMYFAVRAAAPPVEASLPEPVAGGEEDF